MGKLVLAAAIALWLSATASRAIACPAGSPCLKYRNMQQTVSVQPDYFAREGSSTIPKFDRKKLARYLTSARWLPVFGDELTPTRSGIGNPYYRVSYVKTTTKLRFLEPSAKMPAARSDERVVLVRQIERNRDGDIFIDVDGMAYELWYCVSRKRSAPCLTATGTAFNSLFPVDGSESTQPALKQPPF